MRTIFRLTLIFIFLILLIGIIAYARGYRIDVEQKSLTATGILAVNSFPKPAKIYVNGELKGVTDQNLTLPPGHYDVEIKKDGYTAWKKNVSLKGEIVMSLDALLFPKNPSLSPATNIGVVKAVNVDQTDKILIFTENDDIEKDGIYLFDADKKPLSFLPPLTPVVLKSALPAGIDMKKTRLEFSPDYRSVIVDFETETATLSYLFSLDGSNTELFDVTPSKDTIIEAWHAEKNNDLVKTLETFPKKMQADATEAFEVISISPDETKILYKAKKALTLPQVITPALIGANQTQEERTLKKNSIYVYDRKEDKNFPLDSILQGTHPLPSLTPTTFKAIKKPIPTRIPSIANIKTTITPVPEVATLQHYPIMWHPDSKHFVIEHENEVVVYDYDGNNKRTIYSGPFEENFFLITTDGNLFVLSNLNPQNNSFPDLYQIGIK